MLPAQFKKAGARLAHARNKQRLAHAGSGRNGAAGRLAHAAT